MFDRDIRFKTVEAWSDYRNGGALLISGEVQSIDDLKELKQLVDSTNPPIKVRWKIEIVQK